MRNVQYMYVSPIRKQLNVYTDTQILIQILYDDDEVNMRERKNKQ